MKILLAAVNSKFNHTNIAVRSIRLFVKKHMPEADISFGEWTINMTEGEILRGTALSGADMVIFSTYIWNAETIRKIIPDLKKILPETVIGAGGPEAGFFAEGWLSEIPALDFVIKGEGEQTVLEIAEGRELSGIKGIFFRRGGEITFTGERPLLCSLDELEFPYPEITDSDSKIHYYESSRGCPFSCAYCMSSLDKRVRFLSLPRVFADIRKFLDAKVKLVKFVDRTYNLNEERYLAIWQFILDNHNGRTMFHFEIEAEFLSEKALDFLQKVPSGVMQFEIGVQSSNPVTLKAVGRSENTETLAENIRRIPGTIHTHLDLIAGLPHEDLAAFGRSFDFAMALKPDALQLGFLKILHGTAMEDFAREKGWLWMENPPYETLSTPWMGYRDILFLKDLEILLDALYNSGIFSATMKFILRRRGMWDFFSEATDLARESGALLAQRKTGFWFDWMASEMQENDGDREIILELLKFDFLKMGKTSCFPKWIERGYSKERHLEAMNANERLFDARIEFAFSEYSRFSVDPLSDMPEETGPAEILFIYDRPNSRIKKCQVKL